MGVLSAPSVFKNGRYGLGEGNYLKTRILTTVISKPISQGNGISAFISRALPHGLLSVRLGGDIPNVFNTGPAFVSSVPE